MSTFTRYTGNGATASFPIVFPYLRVEHVHVFVNGVEVSWELTSGNALLDVAPAAAADIVIRRQTPTDSLLVGFTYDNAVTPEALQTAYLQAVYAAEDLSETVANLNVGLLDAMIPAATETDRLLISRPVGDGFQWQSIELSGILPLLGEIPAPTAGFKLLGTDDDTDTYRLYDSAELALLIGGGSGSVPSPTGSLRVLMTDVAGTAYQLVTLNSVFTQLGLGTAARANLGVGSGQVPELLPPDGGSGGLARMPAVHVGAMTGIGLEIDYALFSVTLGSAVSCPNNKNLLSGGTVSQGPNSGAWIADTGGGPNPGFTLQPGRYWIDFEAQFPSPSSSFLSIDAVATGGAAVPATLTGIQSFNPQTHSMRGYLTVTVATNVTVLARVTSGSTLFRVAKAHVWKLA